MGNETNQEGPQLVENPNNNATIGTIAVKGLTSPAQLATNVQLAEPFPVHQVPMQVMLNAPNNVNIQSPANVTVGAPVPPPPAKTHVAISCLHVPEYYESTGPNDTEKTMYRMFGIKYVNVVHNNKVYWIYSPQLNEIVTKLGLYV